MAAGKVGAELVAGRLTRRIIGCAIAVHRALGPGLLESAYEECLCCELDANGLCYERQVALPLRYRSVLIDVAYRIDIVVDNQVVVELKAVEALSPLHEAQVLTYLKLSGLPVGLLLNFSTPVLKDGIRRLVI